MSRQVPWLRNMPAPPVAAILVGVVGAAFVLAAHTFTVRQGPRLHQWTRCCQRSPICQRQWVQAIRAMSRRPPCLRPVPGNLLSTLAAVLVVDAAWLLTAASLRAPMTTAALSVWSLPEDIWLRWRRPGLVAPVSAAREAGSAP